MPLAKHLLRLYPRAWRERYAEEFLTTVGDRALTTQHVIDIVAGAIDARLSADVQRVTRVVAARVGGEPMTMKSLALCQPDRSRYSTGDALIGAGVMLGATFVLALLGLAAGRADWPVTADILKSLAFPASLTLSMPFWLLKGQPWKAQVVMTGGTLTLLVVTAYIATML